MHAYCIVIVKQYTESVCVCVCVQDCPEVGYELMLDCWQTERAERPKFTAVVKVLDKFKLFPELLIPVAAVPRYVEEI